MDAIPSPVTHLLELFATDLAHLHFADIDAMSLAEAASVVEASAARAATARAALEAAEAELNTHRENLLVLSQRAMAYARVFAEGNDALTLRLEGIALPRPRRATRMESEPALILSSEPARPRGRPRKAPAPVDVQESIAEVSC